MSNIQYPAITVNLDAIKNNAKVLCDLCEQTGIQVAGVVKFSDCNIQIAKAYAEGGCAQIAVSRAVHLKKIKDSLPEVKTLLTRNPSIDELELAARYGDICLISDALTLRLLHEKAGQAGTRPEVILMLDVGDLREGVVDVEELCQLAILVETELTHLRLLGVGAGFACLNGVLPTTENLSYLVEAAEQVEARIGRRLEIISGGSSINLTMLMNGNQMPPRINHLRLGGSIAAPGNIRRNRGVSFSGLREDAMHLTARLIEVRIKDSAPKTTSSRNWAGDIVQVEDKGKRCRAIAALGSQDIGNADGLIPIDPGVSIVGCSSDHLVLDVTESETIWQTGDLISFEMQYMPMLRGFSGQHILLHYIDDKTTESVFVKH